jgi:signal transduction histidine kinase
MPNITKRFKKVYYISLFTIISVLLFNLILIQYSIYIQKADSKVLNIAGRQRMLSQRIAKVALFIQNNNNKPTTNYNVAKLNSLVNHWERQDSKFSNFDDSDASFVQLIAVNRLYQKPIIESVKVYSQNATKQNLSNLLNTVRKWELKYLVSMENIVSGIQKKSNKKLDTLKIIEFALFVFTIILFVIEILWMINPMLKEILINNGLLQDSKETLEISEKKLILINNDLLITKVELENTGLNNKIIIQQTPNAVAMLDLDLNYLAVSEKWLEERNILEKDVIGKSHIKMFKNLDSDWIKHYQNALEGNIVNVKDLNFTLNNGEDIWLDSNIRPWYLPNQAIGGIIISSLDVTTLKKIYPEKLKTEEILKTTTEISKIGTWEFNLLDGTIFWDNLTKEIHEVLPNYVPTLEKAIDFYKEGGSREAMSNSIYEASQNEKEYDLELEIITAKGNSKWVRAIGKPGFINGQCVKIYGIFQDITEIINHQDELEKTNNMLEILTETLQHKNKQLASFAHITSHNLRSPVGNLNALMGIYKTSNDQEEKDLLIDKFETVIGHMTDTLNTLVDTVRIKESDNSSLTKIHFKAMFDKTLEIISGDILATNANITGDFSDAEYINYNSIYLESIFLNLVSNAIKYKSPDRDPIIHIKTKLVDNRIMMSVTDNGLGIDIERHADKLFGLNKTFHRHKDAKGVGLYLTKTQVVAMGGIIYIESEVGVGSNFIIKF